MNILEYFPNAVECLEDHSEGEMVYFWEHHDDHSTLIKFERCSKCEIPISGDMDVTKEEKEKYMKGEL